MDEENPIPDGSKKSCRLCNARLEPGVSVCDICGASVSESEKERIISLFQSIPGVGQQKAISLYDAGFASLDELKTASSDDIKSAKGVGRSLAGSIANFLTDPDKFRLEGEGLREEYKPSLYMCPDCGAFIAEDSEECSACGAALVEEVEVGEETSKGELEDGLTAAPDGTESDSPGEIPGGLVSCRSCETLIPTGLSACPACGAPTELMDDELYDSKEGATGEDPETMDDFDALLMCPSCGAFISDASRACSVCGSDVTGERKRAVVALNAEADAEMADDGMGSILSSSGALFLCPKCGAFVGESAETCPICGSSTLEDEDAMKSVEDAPESEEYLGTTGAIFLCPKCGAFMSDSTDNCPVCGRGIDEEEVVVEEEEKEETPEDYDRFDLPDPLASEGSLYICQDCGAFVGTSARSCAICGAIVGGEEGAETQEPEEVETAEEEGVDALPEPLPVKAPKEAFETEAPPPAELPEEPLSQPELLPEAPSEAEEVVFQQAPPPELPPELANESEEVVFEPLPPPDVTLDDVAEATPGPIPPELTSLEEGVAKEETEQEQAIETPEETEADEGISKRDGPEGWKDKTGFWEAAMEGMDSTEPEADPDNVDNDYDRDGGDELLEEEFSVPEPEEFHILEEEEEFPAPSLEESMEDLLGKIEPPEPIPDFEEMPGGATDLESDAEADVGTPDDFENEAPESGETPTYPNGEEEFDKQDIGDLGIDIPPEDLSGPSQVMDEILQEALDEKLSLSDIEIEEDLSEDDIMGIEIPEYIELEIEEERKKRSDMDLESTFTTERTREEVLQELQSLYGIGPLKARNLHDAGFDSLKKLNEAPKDDIATVPGIGQKSARIIKRSVEKRFLEKGSVDHPDTVDATFAISEDEYECDVCGTIVSAFDALCYECGFTFEKTFIPKDAREDIDPADMAAMTLEALRRALEHYNKLVEIDQFSVTAWFAKGATHYELDEFENSVKSFNAILDIDPMSQKVWVALAEALRKQGRFDEAAQGYMRSFDIVLEKMGQTQMEDVDEEIDLLEDILPPPELPDMVKDEEEIYTEGEPGLEEIVQNLEETVMETGVDEKSALFDHDEREMEEDVLTDGIIEDFFEDELEDDGLEAITIEKKVKAAPQTVIIEKKVKVASPTLTIEKKVKAAPPTVRKVPVHTVDKPHTKKTDISKPDSVFSSTFRPTKADLSATETAGYKVHKSREMPAPPGPPIKATGRPALHGTIAQSNRQQVAWHSFRRILIYSTSVIGALMALIPMLMADPSLVESGYVQLGTIVLLGFAATALIVITKSHNEITASVLKRAAFFLVGTLVAAPLVILPLLGMTLVPFLSLGLTIAAVVVFGIPGALSIREPAGHLIVWFCGMSYLAATFLFVYQTGLYSAGIVGICFTALSVVGYLTGDVLRFSVEMDVTKGDGDYRSQNYKDAIRHYDDAISSVKTKDEDYAKLPASADTNYEVPYYSKGAALIKLGRFQEATVHLTQALKINDKNEIAWNTLGNAFSRLNKLEKALEAYNRAVKLNTRYEAAWNNMGNILARLQRYKDAIQCYDHALDVDPDYFEAWVNKGYVLVKLGRYDDAAKCAERAVKRNEIASA